jgi:hypothetical protein
MTCSANAPIVFHLVVLASIISGTATADDEATQAQSAYAQTYLDNDFTYLDDPEIEGSYLGDSLKRLRVGNNLTIDLGGQYRTRFHNENNLRGRRLSGRSDDFFLHRTRLFADVRWGEDVRVFAEAIDATSNGERFTSRTSEVNRFDAQNLAVDLRLLAFDGGDSWLRAGRQELVYGSQRLLSNRPWRNTPANFDGVTTWIEAGDNRIDAFWTRPIDIGQHIPDDSNFDSPDPSRQFFGFFAERSPESGRSAELYYFGLVEDDAVAMAPGGQTGNFDIHTIAGRLLGAHSSTLFEIEGGVQFGNFARQRHLAGFVTAGLGRQGNIAGRDSSLWLYYDWASGDQDLNDDTHGTFQHLTPRGHYYLGYADLTGRQNIHDVSLQGQVKVTADARVKIALHNFWLASENDALYSPTGGAIYQDPTGGAGRDIGHELDVLGIWNLSPRINLLAGYSYVWAGDYFDSPVIQGGPAGIAANGSNGDDGEFFYSQLSVRF